MFYENEITIPITATKLNPTEKVCDISSGILRLVSVVFPPGVHRVTKIKIYRYEHQLFPTNLNEELSSDALDITFNEYYPIIGKPYELKIEGWNEGGSYPHTIKVRFGILSTATTIKENAESLSEADLLEIVGEYKILSEV